MTSEKNIGKNCPDLELRYYIECSDKESSNFNDHGRKKRSPFVCQPLSEIERSKRTEMIKKILKTLK